MKRHRKMKVYIYLNILGPNKLYLQDPGHISLTSLKLTEKEQATTQI